MCPVVRAAVVLGVPALFAAGSLLMAQQAPFEGTWELVTAAAAFSPRDTSEGVVFQDKLWLSNAYHSGNVLVRDLWNSADGVTWTKVLEPTRYDGYSEMVVYHGRLWAIKGSVWVSDDGVQWTQVLEKTPFGVCGYGECVVFQDRIWHLGSGHGVYWTTDGAAWTCALPEAPYGPRSACAVGVYKDRLWVMGGWVARPNDPPEKHYKTATSLNDVWSSPDGVHWTRVLEHAPWSERLWFVSETFAGRLWVIGGFSNRESVNFGECWYTEDGAVWERFAPEPHWSPRHEPTTYVFRDALWVVAGNSWPLKNDVWRLVPKAAGR